MSRAEGQVRVQRGFTIVEFMVALLLGTILIGGAISIYLASSRSSQETERSIELLDGGRFAMQIISETLRHAGFFAGVPGGAIVDDVALGAISGTDCAGRAAAHDLRTYLLASVADASGDAFACVDDAVPGTDVLVVKHLEPNPIFDADPNDPTAVRNGALDFPAEPDDARNYIVTTSENGLLMDGADTPPPVAEGETYARGVAWPYSFQVFYVRLDANGETALARKFLRRVGGNMTVATEDLVDGVEDMRIRFRYDSDDDGDVDRAGYADDPIRGNSYDLDNAIGNWDLVGSVEIFLLLRSDEDPAYVDDKSYTLGDKTVTPADNRWRLLLNQYITLRNPNLVIHGGGV
ncbi:MAG: PilW family protein [Halioglobus sp.]|nr:PilW family protein [Halioglobus sp.]